MMRILFIALRGSSVLPFFISPCWSCFGVLSCEMKKWGQHAFRAFPPSALRPFDRKETPRGKARKDLHQCPFGVHYSAGNTARVIQSNNNNNKWSNNNGSSAGLLEQAAL
jgi:hypothetical protein